MDRKDPSEIEQTAHEMRERQDRHDPTLGEDYLSIQHLERYVFATKILSPGMLVLDVACGTGYGAKMLRCHGCRVVGGDLDKGELAMASSKTTDVDFVCLNVLSLPFENNKFDAVVSFETIEHVVEGQRFLAEIHRVLKPGGLFISSTPNIAYTAHPLYHVKEYEPVEFYSVVMSRFKETQKYGQYFRLSDRLSDRLNWLSREGYRQHLICFPPRAILAVSRRLRRLRDRMNSGPATATVPGRKGQEYYAVGPYRGSRLLRIMVTVSVK